MENAIEILRKEILIQFVNHENKATGPVINVPLSITKDNLDELINDIKKKNKDFTEENSEDISYSFMINDKLPIKNSLYEAIKDNNVSSENILSIKYFPLNIFKVKRINNCSATLPGHTNSILCLAFSPNSSHLATGSGDHTVRLWDINTQTPIATLKDHTNWVLVVLFSPDNKFLATAGMDQNICIYDTHTGKLLNILTGHKKEVTTLCFEPLHLLNEKDIKKKSIDTKKRKKIDERKEGNKNNNNDKNKKNKTNKEIENGIGTQANSNKTEGNYDALKDEKTKIEGTIKKEKKEDKNDAKNEKKSSSEISYQKNAFFVRSRLASAGKDGSIRINNILSNSIDKVLTGHTDTITCILWSGKNEKNSRIYSSSRDRTIKIWNVNEGTLLYDFKGHSHWVNCLSLNSERIIKNGIYNIDVIINKIHIENHIEKSKNIYKKFFKNQRNEKLVSGSDDGTLYLIDCLKNNQYKSTRLVGHQKPVIHTQFSPDGKLIASSSFDKSVRIWSSANGQFLAVYRGHVGPVYKLAWSIDNNYFVSCSHDSTLKLWKVNHLNSILKSDKENGDDTKNIKDKEQTDQEQEQKKKQKQEQLKNKKIKTLLVDLPGHADAVYAIDWSNDGKYVASGGKDKVLKIWSH